MGDRLEEIKEYNPMHLSDAERAEHFEKYCVELLAEVKTLRHNARAGDDEPPLWDVFPGIVKTPAPVDLDAIGMRAAIELYDSSDGDWGETVDSMVAEIVRLRDELKRLAALTGSLAPEVEALKRERDEAATGWTESIEISGELSMELVSITLERDELRDELDQARQDAVSLIERVTR